MENKTRNTQPDYEAIRRLSRRVDCTVTEADFNTNYPNPRRIDSAASDIHRYLKYTGEAVR